MMAASSALQGKTGAANADGMVGPNAIIQIAAALRAAGGEAKARQVFAAANLTALLSTPPEHMVDQAVAGCLHDALRNTIPGPEAERIARDAGCRTADYLLANRIPQAVQWLMKILPATLSARILLKAMQANAWTYAGTGNVRTAPGNPCVLTITHNPLAQPGCPWHCGVFERLFQTLVHNNAAVAYVSCRACGTDTCRFEVSWP
jgi:divinyl protochlorophyllide a 8-vinyl-reductase